LKITPAIRSEIRPMGKKTDKKQLNEPDKLQLFFLSVRTFMEKHKNRIYAGAGGFLIILVMLCGWYLYKFNYEKSAGKIYSKIIETAQKVESSDGDQTAIKDYKDLIAQYPRSRAAVLARFRLGNLYFSRHEIDSAILAYKDFLNESPAYSDLVTLAYNALGASHEIKKNFKESIEAYESAIKSNTATSFEALNYISIARVHEAMNSPEKAVEFYRKALGKTTDPLTTLYLKRKISVL
jgi:tetratricopeptide (TPR) repeat protein